MSGNAIDMRAATGTPSPQANDEQMSGLAMPEVSACSHRRGPNALQTTMLIGGSDFPRSRTGE